MRYLILFWYICEVSGTNETLYGPRIGAFVVVNFSRFIAKCNDNKRLMASIKTEDVLDAFQGERGSPGEAGASGRVVRRQMFSFL